MRRLVRAARPAFRSRGFTLIELLVAVTIVAIGAMLAAPGAASMIANRRVQGAAQTILDGLNQGRSEAVRRNGPVSFTLNTANGWQLDSGGTNIRTYTTSDWTSLVITSTPSTSLTFLPTGLIDTAGSPLTQVTVASTVTDTRTRQINVFGGGLIRVCDPAVTAANDPRKC
jgi:type IV fimbrial biogenesis protein FimT